VKRKKICSFFFFCRFFSSDNKIPIGDNEEHFDSVSPCFETWIETKF